MIAVFFLLHIYKLYKQYEQKCFIILTVFMSFEAKSVWFLFAPLTLIFLMVDLQNWF